MKEAVIGPTCHLNGEDSIVVSCASCGIPWFFPCVCGVSHVTWIDGEPICAKCAPAYPPEVLRARIFARRAR